MKKPELDRLEIIYRAWADSPEPIMARIAADALGLLAHIRELEADIAETAEVISREWVHADEMTAVVQAERERCLAQGAAAGNTKGER